jgi:hypothetical protein
MEMSGLELASFDRMFPSQDELPDGALGNLIALPLQGAARKRAAAVFPDPATFEPYADQWAVLASAARIGAEALARRLQPRDERGPRTASQAVGDAAGSRARELVCVAGSELVCSKSGMTAPLVADLRRLASIADPVFHERQRLRLSTYRTPRWVRCYEEDRFTLRLPRGLRSEVETAVAAVGAKLVVTDDRPSPVAVPFEFTGRLTF